MRIASPEPDTYGQDARASLLADYVELLALKGGEVKQTIVADFLAENDWNLQLIEEANGEFEPPASFAEKRDAAGEDAGIVFEQIAERREVLSTRYPFVSSEDGISLRQGVNVEESVYVALLTITIAHAFGVRPTDYVASVFERAVSKVLAGRGLRSVCFAEIRRNAPSFPAAVKQACDAVGLRANPDAVPRRTHAQDEGVDVLFYLNWEYARTRPGAWAFIGQATVGRSESWWNKINEPSPKAWGPRIGSILLPLPFLAVPHHVERRTLQKLTIDGDALVLDRLRLAQFKQDVNDDERATIRAVTDQEVEPLGG